MYINKLNFMNKLSENKNIIFWDTNPEDPLPDGVILKALQ